MDGSYQGPPSRSGVNAFVLPDIHEFVYAGSVRHSDNILYVVAHQYTDVTFQVDDSTICDLAPVSGSYQTSQM